MCTKQGQAYDWQVTAVSLAATSEWLAHLQCHAITLRLLQIEFSFAG